MIDPKELRRAIRLQRGEPPEIEPVEQINKPSSPLIPEKSTQIVNQNIKVSPMSQITPVIDNQNKNINVKQTKSKRRKKNNYPKAVHSRLPQEFWVYIDSKDLNASAFIRSLISKDMRSSEGVHNQHG